MALTVTDIYLATNRHCAVIEQSLIIYHLNLNTSGVTIDIFENEI